MNRPSQAEKEIRKAGCNALVSALVFLMEPANQNIGRRILVVAQSMDAWHSIQHVELRSVHGTLKWHYDQIAKSEFMASLHDTWSKLFDTRALEFVGMQAGPFPEPLEPAHPEVLARDTLAHVLGHGAKCFVAARLRKCMRFLRGWPSNAIRFTSESSAQRRSGATLLKGDYEAWVALGLRKEPPCIQMY